MSSNVFLFSLSQYRTISLDLITALRALPLTVKDNFSKASAEKFIPSQFNLIISPRSDVLYGSKSTVLKRSFNGGNNLSLSVVAKNKCLLGKIKLECLFIVYKFFFVCFFSIKNSEKCHS